MADFSASELVGVQLKAEKMWNDGQFKQDYVADVDVIKAIKERQTARITELENPEKDYDVAVNWLDTSAVSAIDAVSNCDIDEPTVGSKSKPYALDIFKKSGFSFSEQDLRTNIYGREEAVAMGTLRAMMELDNAIATAVAAKAVGYAGTNLAPGAHSYAAGVTTVAAAKYNRSLMASLLLTARKNKMRNPFIVEAGELYEDYLNAGFDAANSNGGGDAARTKALQTYFDLVNFAAAGTPVDLLLINQGALAFASKVHYGSTPVAIGGDVNQTRYSVASNNIPGVSYDVFYKTKCANIGGKDHITHHWRFEAKAGLLLNPEGEAAGNNGVLAFAKGV